MKSVQDYNQALCTLQRDTCCSVDKGPVVSHPAQWGIVESAGNMRISSLPGLGKAGVTFASSHEVRQIQPDFQLLSPKTGAGEGCFYADFG